jgi:hypothetical protein
MKTRFTVVTAVVGLFAASTAGAQEMTFTGEEIAGAPSCGSASSLEDGQSELCRCASGAMSGSVWGSLTYTSDSSVCAAALHAGAVPAEGGAIVITSVDGQESYAGTTSNGITTRDWGSYGSSFQVAAARANSALAECGVMPSDADVHSCNCPKASGNTGSVWGYGPYTSDSDICSAARHDGYIGEAGGPVRVLRIQGLESYVGQEANGVNTSAWRAYSSSIVFDWNAP